MKQLANCDIVMMALSRWDAPYSSSSWSLAKELSKHTRVFYVDNPVTIKEYLTHSHAPEMQRRKEALFMGSDFFTLPEPGNPNLFAITPHITLPVNWLPGGWLYNRLSAFNNAIVANALNHLLRIFAIKKYILVNSFNPLISNDMPLKVKPQLTVYHSVDDIHYAPYLKKHGPPMEEAWMTKSDFTIATSAALKRKGAKFARQIFYLPNAADTALFRQAVKDDFPVPGEIQQHANDKKVICYIGNICQRIDYSLLETVAKAHSNKIILMIGPLTKTDYGAGRLKKYSNIIFTGAKKMRDLPAYLQHSHCCIIPFLCNTLTSSIYPLKINEYLSAGKPVVSTPFSEDIRGFKNVAMISRNAEEFVRFIDIAIHENADSLQIQRMLFAASNSWEARAHHFIDLSVEFLKQHNGRTGEPDRRKQSQASYR